MKHIYPEGAVNYKKYRKSINFSYYALILFLFGISYETFATRYTTKQNGNFTTNSTWENNTPPPLVGGGSSALYTDSIFIKHKINIANNIIRVADYFEISLGGRLYSSNTTNGLVILDGATGVNNDSIDINNLIVEGDFYNNKYLKLRDLQVTSVGYLFINTSGYIQTLQPANNQGTIFNKGVFYSPGNFINNSGTLTGDGGSYFVDGNLTNNSGATTTCGGSPINICRTDSTFPVINGSGTVDSGCVMICGVLLGGALPVKLISFYGIYENEKVTLTWKTATEINNHYFEVQRSLDGKNWKLIDKVYSKVVNSSELQKYTYTDKEVDENSTIVYYRLKQVDTDGKYEYLPVIYIELTDESNFMVDVYPNPASNNIGVKITQTGKATESEIILSDLFGSIVYRGNSTANLSITNISTDDIPNGLYYIIVRQNETETIKKIMVQR